MQYTYLNWSLFLLAIWGLVFMVTRDAKRKMLIVSAGTMPLGLTEPLFYPEYWFPPTLFDLAARTGFDLESLIFSFSVGGLASSLYDLWRPVALEHMPGCARTHHRHRFHQLALASPVLVFLPLFVYTPLNPIYSASIALGAGGVATALCRPDLAAKMMRGAFIFASFYFLFFATMSWAHPNLVTLYWNMGDISGLMMAGVPLEELLFAGTFGLMWSGLYEHLGWYREV